MTSPRTFGSASAPALPYPVPIGETARRLEWAHLPAHVRAEVELRCGSPVVHATSQGTGFTPGFASILVCADGSRHFVKAASAVAQRAFAASYREEARKLQALPEGVPAPRLLWSIDGDWVVLGIEYVAATHPSRPWQAEEFAACLDALEVVAQQLTPVPVGLELPSAAEEFAQWPAFWDHVRRTRPGLPHLEEAAALAADHARTLAGDTVVHLDVRDDNVLIDSDGHVSFCDWNWPVVGAAWVDTVLAMIGPRGDGCDVETMLSERALTRTVPAEAIDTLLALVAGYFFDAADQPVPPSSPWIREHQGWCRDVVWGWLCERRGWV